MEFLLDPASYRASPYAIPTLATAVAMLVLGAGALLRERGSREARLFFGFSVAVAIWLGCFSAMYLAVAEPAAFFWARAAYLGIAFIPAAVSHFAVALARQRRRLWVVLAWALGAIFCVLMVGTDALFRELYHYSWGYYPHFRWLGAPFLVFFFTALLLGLKDLHRAFRAAQDTVHRQRARWLLLAFAIAYLGSVDYLAAYGIPVYPFGYVPVVVFILLAAWTIRVYRLVDFTPELAARQILATMADPLLVCDLDGSIRLANGAAARLLGYRESELAHSPLSSLLPGDQELLRRIQPQKEGRELEAELVAKSGERIACELLLSPLNDAGGVAVGSILIARDLRQRKAAEAQVRRSEARYRHLFDDNPCPMWVHDARSLHFLAVNDATVAHFGYPRGELLGLSLRNLDVAEPVPVDASPAADAPAVWRHRTKDGRSVEVEVTAHDMEFDGRPARLVLAVDVTQRRRSENALRSSEERFRTLTESAPAAILISEDERFVYLNTAAELLTGRSATELSAMRPADIAYPGSRERLAALLASVRDGIAPARSELRLDARGTDERWVDLTIASLGPAGDRTAVMTAFDISESRRAQDAARTSERRLREMLDNVHLAALTLDTQGCVTYANDFLAELLACDLEDLMGCDWFEGFVPASQRETLRGGFQDRLAAGGVNAYEEHELETHDGERRLLAWNHAVLRDARGSIVGVASIGADITERKRVEDRLVHEAFHDALTGLPNRALFMDRLRVTVARARRRGDFRFAVLFVDLDRFKVVNDSLGHLLGDLLLVLTARRLERCMRVGDTVARLGGDEFIVLLEDLDSAAEAVHVAEHITTALREPFDLEGHEVFTTASIGIALGSTRYERADDLLRDADTALHRAKRAGKSVYQVFDTPMHVQAVAALELENDLRRSLDNRELVLYYQPIVNLPDERITGYEALLRWQHPQRGLLGPDDFIGLAEETGLILPIGDWVLREACRQLRSWSVESPLAAELMLTVNLSSRQFAQGDLVERIARTLREADVEPRRIKLEVTESLILENPDTAAQMLRNLRDLGCGICLDDFGTGYSSLSYLLQLPIDTLKVDRSFLADLGTGSRTSEIVWAVIVLGQRLKMEVIAEGVETAEQKRHLIELGCRLGQGFFFSHAREPGAALALLPGGTLSTPRGE